MNRSQRFRHQMLIRVRDFGKEHQTSFPESSMGALLFAALATAVESIEQYLTNRVVAKAEASKVKASTKAAVYEYLKALAITGRRVTEGEPGANPFRVPKNRAMSQVLSTARAFIAEAKPREEQFVRRGLPATFLADFGKLVDELEGASAAQLNSRTERRLASTGIEQTLEQAMDTVRELDAFVPNALRLDPIRVGAWRAARRIDGLHPPASAAKPAKGDGKVPASSPEAPTATTPTLDDAEVPKAS